MLLQWLTSTWRRTMFVAALFALLLMGGAPQKVHALSASQLIALTNTQRTANGLPPLAANSKLSSSAAAKAQHMVVNGYWAHTAPDGTTPWAFVRNAGYVYTMVGENLAKDFLSDQAVVTAWMGSATHRANILSPKFKDVGIAVHGSIVVAHYGSSAAASSAPAPRTTAPKPAHKTVTQPVKKKPAITKPQPAAVPAPAPLKQPVLVVRTESPRQPTKKPYQVLLEQLAMYIAREDWQQSSLALVQ